MAWLVISVAVGVAVGISVYCLRGFREISKIKELYEEYLTDLIEELEVYRNEDTHH